MKYEVLNKDENKPIQSIKPDSTYFSIKNRANYN